MEDEITKIKEFFNNNYIGNSIFGKIFTYKVINITDETGWTSIKYIVKVEVTERKIRGYGYIEDGETYDWWKYDPNENKTYIEHIEINDEMKFTKYMNRYGGKIEVKIN